MTVWLSSGPESKKETNMTSIQKYRLTVLGITMVGVVAIAYIGKEAVSR